MTDSRVRKGKPEKLAAALAAMSPGRAPSMWARVRFLRMPCLNLAGSFDSKFVGIALRLAAAWGQEVRRGQGDRSREGSLPGDRGTLTSEGASTSCTGSPTEQTRTGGESRTPGQLDVFGQGSTESQQGSSRGIGDAGDYEDSAIQREVAASRAVVVEGCGHAVHIESPLAVVHEILRFLASTQKTMCST